MTPNEYKVTGMTCGHCELSIREEIEQIAGLQVVEVNAQTGKLVVSSSSEADEARVLAAVEEAGYSATRIS